MKRRVFLIPSLLAAGFLPAKADALPGVPSVKKPDPQSIFERLRIRHLYTLAGHRSHSSHSSHASHSSHSSSTGGGYIGRSDPSPTYSAPTYNPTPSPPAPTATPLYSAPAVTPPPAVPASPAPAQSAIAPAQNPPLKVLPGNSNKFKQIVILVQSGLTAYGYYGGPLTGSVDEDTRAALRQMQQDNNLKVTGTVTIEVLNAFGISAQ